LGGPPIAGPRLPAGDETICRVCREPVAAGRRFCRCGTPQFVAQHQVRGPQSAPKLPWYRGLGAHRDFRRSMRTANGGLRVGYSAVMSVRARFVRLTMLLAVAGVGLSQLGPWGVQLRAQLQQRVDTLLPHTYSAVKVAQAATNPARPALPGFDTGFVVDGDPGRAWAGQWQSPVTPGPPCQRQPVAPTLLLTFSGQSSVDRVTIRPGLSGDNPQRVQQARPKTVDVLFSDGTCLTRQLADKPDPQEFDVKVGGATGAQLAIIDVYSAGADAPGGAAAGAGPQNLVAVSEIGFQHRD
jgi:hypothetical protein